MEVLACVLEVSALFSFETLPKERNNKSVFDLTGIHSERNSREMQKNFNLPRTISKFTLKPEV